MNVYDILLGEHDVTEYFKMQEALLMLAGLVWVGVTQQYRHMLDFNNFALELWPKLECDFV